jgi:hypothetical protein
MAWLALANQHSLVQSPILLPMRAYLAQVSSSNEAKEIAVLQRSSFPTIVAQLIQQLPSIAPLVRNEVENEPVIHKLPLKDQFDRLIIKPIGELPRNSEPATLVIVVDALDECHNLEDIRCIIYLLCQRKRLRQFG